MNLKNYLKLSVILPIIGGMIIGGLLFWLGAIDDAPGLCLIGVTITFLLLLWGIKNTDLIKKNQLTYIISLCFGAGFFVMSWILKFDGEFDEIPFAFYGGLSFGSLLFCFGIMKWLKYKRTK